MLYREEGDPDPAEHQHTECQELDFTESFRNIHGTKKKKSQSKAPRTKQPQYPRTERNAVTELLLIFRIRFNLRIIKIGHSDTNIFVFVEFPKELVLFLNAIHE